MSSFTTSFKDALEFDPTIESVILTEYPIYNEEYRPHLNMLIKDQYWNREIGQETVSMFKLALKRKLDQIMPYYNEQYRTSLIQAKIDPLQTLRIDNSGTNTGTTDSVSGSDSESGSDAKSRAVGSDFPQTSLSDQGDYASSSNDSTSKTTATSKANERAKSEQSGKSTGSVKGSQGHQSELLMRHRKAIVNVDVMLIDELDELFYGLFSTGDSFTQNTMIGYSGYGNGIYGIFGY